MDDESLPPRILAVDPGQKRIGLAVSDPFGNFAVGLDTLANGPGQTPLNQLTAICQQYAVSQIVVGLPLHMNGDEGESARLAREFAETLQTAVNIPVELMDERLTSRVAAQSLREQGIQSSKKRKTGIIDQAAAMRLLQDYLDRRANRNRLL
jgi:putative holliday junction resolvase